MKTILIVIVALIVGICIGMNLPTKVAVKQPVPLPCLQSDSLDWDAEEFLMSSAIGQKCIDNNIEIATGEDCVVAVCGKEQAGAEFPEIKQLTRDCYWSKIYDVDLNKYYNDANLYKDVPPAERFRLQPREWNKVVNIMKAQTFSKYYDSSKIAKLFTDEWYEVYAEMNERCAAMGISAYECFDALCGKRIATMDSIDIDTLRSCYK